MQAVLVDTVVWIRAFRGDPSTAPLVPLLRDTMAHAHPWSIAELRLGSGIHPDFLDSLLHAPRVCGVPDDDAVAFLGYHRLERSGIGWVDLQLLASAHRRGVALWTFDEPLREAARAVRLPQFPR